MTNFQPNAILRAAELNGAFAEKADLDPITGRVKADQLPDLAAIADERLDVRLPPIAAEIQSAVDLAQAAQSAAAGAAGALAMATAAALTADGKAESALAAANSAADDAAGALAVATAAQASADGKIPLSQKGAVNGVATLGSDGIVPASQLPVMGGGGSSDVKAFVNFSPQTGVIRSSKNVSSVSSDAFRAWAIHFATPLANANYTAVFGGKFGNDAGDSTIAIVSEPRRQTSSRDQTYLSVIASWQNGGTGVFDAVNIETISVAVLA